MQKDRSPPTPSDKCRICENPSISIPIIWCIFHPNYVSKHRRSHTNKRKISLSPILQKVFIIWNIRKKKGFHQNGLTDSVLWFYDTDYWALKEEASFEESLWLRDGVGKVDFPDKWIRFLLYRQNAQTMVKTQSTKETSWSKPIKTTSYKCQYMCPVPTCVELANCCYNNKSSKWLKVTLWSWVK